MLMFAYGSNLNVDQMARRCPAAEPIGRLKLQDWRLVFRGVADVIPEPGAVCYGGVWRITPACEEALDRYEGVDSGLYTREWIPIKPGKHGETAMLVYCMTSTGIMPPSAGYLQCIKDGYRDFAMPPAAWGLLKDAVRTSHDDKAPTHLERQRRMRTGRPAFAPRPKDPKAA